VSEYLTTTALLYVHTEITSCSDHLKKKILKLSLTTDHPPSLLFITKLWVTYNYLCKHAGKLACKQERKYKTKSLSLRITLSEYLLVSEFSHARTYRRVGVLRQRNVSLSLGIQEVDGVRDDGGVEALLHQLHFLHLERTRQLHAALSTQMK